MNWHANSSDMERRAINEELRGSRWVLWTVFVALASFFIWANFSEIDQITRAPGEVIPSSNVQLIQSKDGGVLEASRTPPSLDWINCTLELGITSPGARVI